MCNKKAPDREAESLISSINSQYSRMLKYAGYGLKTAFEDWF